MSFYQAISHDDGFIGFSDFLMRNDHGEYEVYDTKLARHAKISALLQVAAYADKIADRVIPVGKQVHLILGDGTTTTHDLVDITPVYRIHQAHLRRVIAERDCSQQAERVLLSRGSSTLPDLSMLRKLSCRRACRVDSGLVSVRQRSQSQ